MGMAVARKLSLLVHDYSNMTLGNTWELVLEAVGGDVASLEKLLALQCKTLIALLCEVTGTQKAYLGQSKRKLTEQLLRAVAIKEGIALKLDLVALHQSPTPFRGLHESQLPRKRAKIARPVPLAGQPPGEFQGRALVCRNLACRATVKPEESFCRRCSCCICRKFDENKDPSLWVVCGDDSADTDRGCGYTSHLDCALRAQLAGVSTEDGSPWKLDGAYSCPMCGHVTNLFVTCKKQLEKAKEARRVDTVCHRLSLADRILVGSERHKELQSLVSQAVRTLENEVGPLESAAVNASRSCVTRLKNDVWDEITVCIDYALELVGLQLQSADKYPQCQPEERVSGQHIDLQVKAVKTNSITISWKAGDPVLEGLISHFKIWICKSGELNFTASPNCIFKSSERRAIAHNLDEGTEYMFKLVAFDNDRVVGVGEVKGSTPKLKSTTAKDDQEEKRVVRPSAPIEQVLQPSNQQPIPFKDDDDTGGPADSVQHWAKDGETISVETDLKDHGTREKTKSPSNSEGEQLGFGSSHGASSVTHSSSQLPAETPQVSSRQDEDHKYESRDIDTEETPVTQVKDVGESTSASEGGKQGVTDLQEVPCTSVSLPKDVDDETKLEGEEAEVQLHLLGGASSASPPPVKEKTAGCPSVPATLPHIVHAETEQKVPTFATLEVSDQLGGGCGSEKETLLQSLKAVDQKPEVKLEYRQLDTGTSEAGRPITADKPTGSKEEPGKDIKHELFNNNLLQPEALKSVRHVFERCVKVIRLLEKQGHLPSEFRKAFLTWLSRRATAADKEEVTVFIDTLGDDPEQLAGQLIDTYEEVITSKKPRFEFSQAGSA